MVLFLSKVSFRINKIIAPFFLNHGLTVRSRLLGILGWEAVHRHRRFLDSLVLLPFWQRIISLELQTDIIQQSNAHPKKQPKEKSSGKLKRNVAANDGKLPIRKQREEDPYMTLFENYLRPVLIPNQSWSDVITRWIWDDHMVKFIRSEFLFAKYWHQLQHVEKHNHKLFRGPQFTKTTRIRSDFLWNNYFSQAQNKVTLAKKPNLYRALPSTHSVLRVLQMEKTWKRQKDVDNSFTHAARQEIVQSLLDEKKPSNEIMPTALQLPFETKLEHLPLDSVLELGGAQIQSSGLFNFACEYNNIYQLWTQEYIARLGDYLLERIQHYSSTTTTTTTTTNHSNNNNNDGPTLVLDVGAGDGLLSQLLKDYFDNNNNVISKKLRRSGCFLPDIVAIDDKSWKIPAKSTASGVETMTVQEALDRYGALYSNIVVLCSWMPMGVDWTHYFRQESGGGVIHEYILIGEYDDGTCGDNWLTWGNAAALPQVDNKNDNGAAKPIPPYQVDGYERVDLTHLSKYSFSRFDTTNSANSGTVSFRRGTINNEARK